MERVARHAQLDLWMVLVNGKEMIGCLFFGRRSVMNPHPTRFIAHYL